MTSKLHFVAALTLVTGGLYLAAALTLTACGVRTRLEDGARVSDVSQLPDAGLDASDAAGQAVADSSSASIERDAGQRSIDVFALLPASNAGPAVVCASCVETNCGSAINACVNDRKCVAGIGCALAQCSASDGADTASGVTDFACLLACFDGDFMAAAQVLRGVICLTQTCSDSCSSLLPSTTGGDAVATLDGRPGSGGSGGVVLQGGVAGAGSAPAESGSVLGAAPTDRDGTAQGGSSQ